MVDRVNPIIPVMRPGTKTFIKSCKYRFAGKEHTSRPRPVTILGHMFIGDSLQYNVREHRRNRDVDRFWISSEAFEEYIPTMEEVW